MLAQGPELRRLGARLGDDAVEGDLLLEGRAQHRLRRFAQARQAGRRLDQHEPFALGDGRLQARMLGDKLHGGGRDQLEGRDLVAEFVLGECQKPQGGGRIGDGEQRRHGMLRPRQQPQDRRRDDAERALAADEELLPVVARIVLAQPAQAIDDGAVGQHHLEPEHEAAGHAVAQHVHAARIGRHDPADGGRAFGRQADRQEAACGGRSVLRHFQDAAGLGLDGQADGIDMADRRHAVEGEDDLPARGVRNRAAGEPRVAALGHDGGAGLAADLHDLGHLLGRGRAHDAGRLSRKELAPVDRIRLEIGSFGNDGRRAQKPGQALQQVLRLGHLRSLAVAVSFRLRLSLLKDRAAIVNSASARMHPPAGSANQSFA